MQTQQKLTPNSSNIKRVIKIEDEIIVEFKFGTYSCSGGKDTDKEWKELISAESTGKAVNSILKPNYTTEKITNETVLKLLKYAEFPEVKG